MNMASVNERDLLAAATQGSQVAYRELIHLHQAAVYRFAWAMIGEEHAQTVTENAFITAWRQLEFLPAINLSFHTHLLQLVCIDCTELAKRQLPVLYAGGAEDAVQQRGRRRRQDGLAEKVF